MPRSLAYQRENALNAICPYFTMFPLEYPLRVLRLHKSAKPVVMDPFCGRGTTLFAARKLGLAARGIDSSPIAVAIARAKLAAVDPTAIARLADTYLENYANASLPASKFFKHAFTPKTLREICAIREGLMRASRDTDTSVMLRATMLGCLHGPLNRSPDNLAYFSNQMPRTFAPKPDYAMRFWAERDLSAPEVDVTKVLRKKLARLEEEDRPSAATFVNARHGDSRFASSLPASTRDFSIVVTSPPYYGMKTYVQDQWLRNWFLGGPDHVEYGNNYQLEHSGVDIFCASLGKVWRNMARTNTNDLDMYIRFGIIPSCKVSAKDLIRRSLEVSGISWKLLRVTPAKTASSGKRQANHMAAASDAALEYDFHVRRN